MHTCSLLHVISDSYFLVNSAKFHFDKMYSTSTTVNCLGSLNLLLLVQLHTVSLTHTTKPVSLKICLFIPGQYPAVAVAGSPTGVAPSPQHQMPITSQPQPEMYMSGVQMNGSGMGGSDYQTGSNVGANVQSQVRHTDVS